VISGSGDLAIRSPDHSITRSPDVMILDAVRRTIDRHALWRGGSRVVVAVSGGADSVALLLILKDLEGEGLLTIAGVAHLNHQLRGADADADEAFCAALAARFGVPFAAERVDVAALARAGKRSIEDAARTARQAFFERAATALDADVVAVAHTKDDQAETFLLRLMRGAGTRGLAAIRPRVRLPTVAPAAGRWVVRPVLEVERAALREFLAARGETFREDATNADVAIPRNRVRHELLPYLRSHFSPGVSDVLARAAELARQDEDFLHAEAIKLAARIVLSDVTVRLDAAGLSGAPRALSSRVAHAALQRLAGSKPIHFEHVDRLLALAADAARGEGRAISLPGQIAVRVGNEVVLHPAIGRRTSDVGYRNSFAFALSIPGEVQLGSHAVAAERLEGPAAAQRRQSRWEARGAEVGVAAGALSLPLAVRSRRPGDRFQPLGAPGRRKLQDFLVDRKVKREDRDAVPLVVDALDRIVWVVGQSVAEDFRVTDPSQGVILLKVRHLGGVG
jgi:tRNA(Ile)-lysidine synthase